MDHSPPPAQLPGTHGLRLQVYYATFASARSKRGKGKQQQARMSRHELGQAVCLPTVDFISPHLLQKPDGQRRNRNHPPRRHRMPFSKPYAHAGARRLPTRTVPFCTLPIITVSTLHLTIAVDQEAKVERCAAVGVEDDVEAAAGLHAKRLNAWTDCRHLACAPVHIFCLERDKKKCSFAADLHVPTSRQQNTPSRPFLSTKTLLDSRAWHRALHTPVAARAHAGPRIAWIRRDQTRWQQRR